MDDLITGFVSYEWIAAESSQNFQFKTNLFLFDTKIVEISEPKVQKHKTKTPLKTEKWENLKPQFISLLNEFDGSVVGKR